MMHKDRKLIVISLIVAIVCLIPFYSSELQSIWFVNHFLISSVPIAVALLMLLIPIMMAYAIRGNDKAHLIEIAAKKDLKKLKKKQVIHAFTKVRSHNEGSEWYIRNNSSFEWDHAVVYLEYENASGLKETEKHHVHHLGSFEGQALISSKEYVACDRKRALIVTNKGYSLEIPFLWKPVHDWDKA